MIDERGSARSEKRPVPWIDAVALAALWVGVILGQVWVFGVLFVSWAIYDIVRRRTHFINEFGRSDQPIMFWLIAISWLILGILAFWR